MKLCKHISNLVTWDGNGRRMYASAFETRVGKHLFHSILKLAADAAGGTYGGLTEGGFVIYGFGTRAIG